MRAISDHLLYREQLNVMELQLLRGLPGPTLAAVASGYLFWDKLDTVQVAIWTLAIVANSMATWTYALYSRKHQTSDIRVIKQRFYVRTVFGFLAGLLWSIPLLTLTAYDFSDFNHVFQFIYFSLLVIGLGAGALGANATYLPAYYFFILPFMVTFWNVTIFVIDIEEFHILGYVTVFYFFILTRFAHTLNADLKNSIRMRYENKVLADEYREQKEKAEKSDMAKSRFLAAASHDLRQPLQALGFYTESLRQPQYVTPNNERLINGIYGTTESLRSMLNVILDLSKIQSGTLETEWTRVPLSQLFYDVSRQVSQQAQAKQIDVSVVNSSLTVNSDVTILTRVLLNLLSNAIRYTQHGKVCLGARRRPKGMVEIQVWDTGIGIAEQDQAYIFEEYFQVGNAERDRQQGLGLGLSIVKGLLISIGSDIQVRSVQGKGSCFSFCVPVCDAPEVNRAPVVPTESPASDLNVLIVDDDQDILSSLSLLLVSWNYNIEVADGPAAVRDILDRHFVPDVVLCDFRLRDHVSGIDVMNDIQRRDIDFLGVLITGDTAEERLQQARETHYRLLHKPVKPAALRLLLSRYAASRSVDLSESE